MNTTPEQLRLIADIIEGNKPFEVRRFPDHSWQNPGHEISWYIADNRMQAWEIRIRPATFPPKPDGMEWRLCNGLTPELCGPDHRPFVKGESANQPHEFYAKGEWFKAITCDGSIDRHDSAYRLPLSTPYPDGSKVVDGQLVKPCSAKYSIGQKVRVKYPEAHRAELVKSESSEGVVTQILPDERKRFVYICDGIGSWFEDQLEPAPEPKPVALGPEDVPPGSVFRMASFQRGFRTVAIVTDAGVGLPFHESSEDSGIYWFDWEELASAYEIHRPGNLDPSGKPVWEPCHKLP